MDVTKLKNEAIEVHCMDSFLLMADCRMEHPEYFEIKKKKSIDQDVNIVEPIEAKEGSSDAESRGEAVGHIIDKK